MKIVLLGYMGSGKSTVGKLLAARLNIPFVDLDDYLETRLGASVPSIFAEKGEIYFRKKEHEFLQEVLADPKSKVIALGGGTPCYSGNMDLVLKQTPLVFYLMLPVPELVGRLQKEKATRPLIRDISDEELPEFIGKHLFDRWPFYSRAAHTIAIAGKEAAGIAGEIANLLV